MVYWAMSQVDSTAGIAVRDGYVDGDDAAFGEIVDAASASLPEGPSAVVWATLSATHVPVPEFGDSSKPRVDLIADVERKIRDEEKRQRSSGSMPSSSLHPTRPGSVKEQWARITDWLHERFPENSISGAESESIEQAISATGQKWPAELVEFFELVNGDTSGPAFVAILPRFQFLGLDHVVGERARMIEIWADVWSSRGLEVPPSAGENAFTFAPAFVPFAGMDGNFLFVDTRPGGLYGCVSEFDKSGSDERGPRWLSISAMLTDLADSLTQNNEFDEGWMWSTEGGALQWDWSRAHSVARDIRRAIQDGRS
ncbi:SMI1/KNR4 family protein [Rhodococcoides yunnanense]|uniref:SMI1/KNR4 family protein n=1 Tax=Rhodococcoides yunnanense TaxID=278209 RepID=A0ABU4B737_9NOCA|nr:SMI1/KNR4 family protein [Rhodococcus yunnanensis]MDV6259974.1 SMI1/KNR4 family protein [Rhodococcus yunnanensis]